MHTPPIDALLSAPSLFIDATTGTLLSRTIHDPHGFTATPASAPSLEIALDLLPPVFNSDTVSYSRQLRRSFAELAHPFFTPHPDSPHPAPLRTVLYAHTDNPTELFADPHTYELPLRGAHAASAPHLSLIRAWIIANLPETDENAPPLRAHRSKVPQPHLHGKNLMLPILMRSSGTYAHAGAFLPATLTPEEAEHARAVFKATVPLLTYDSWYDMPLVPYTLSLSPDTPASPASPASPDKHGNRLRHKLRYILHACGIDTPAALFLFLRSVGLYPATGFHKLCDMLLPDSRRSPGARTIPDEFNMSAYRAIQPTQPTQPTLPTHAPLLLPPGMRYNDPRSMFYVYNPLYTQNSEDV